MPSGSSGKQQAADRKAVAKSHRAAIKAREARDRKEAPQIDRLRATASQVRERKLLNAESRTRMARVRGELEAELGRSRVRTGGSGSSYAKIHKTFVAYEEALADRDLEKQTSLLATLERLALAWLNDPEHKEPAARGRREVVGRLSDQVALEQLALGRHRAQEVYLASLTAGEHVSTRTWADDGTAGVDRQKLVDDGYQHKFQVATGPARVSGAQAAGGALSWWDDDQLRFQAANPTVRPAELAAIRTYTAGDFNYLNPSAANSPGWMRAVQDKKDHNGKLENPVLNETSTKTIMEEGSLHTAVAMSGLRKLPQYDGVAYRGETRTRAQLAALGIVPGGRHVFPNLTSTAKAVAPAKNFGLSNGDPAKVTVLWELYGCGKDVQDASMFHGEQEVLVLAGEAVEIVSVEEVTAETAADERPVMTAAKEIADAAARAPDKAVDGVWVVTVRSATAARRT